MTELLGGEAYVSCSVVLPAFRHLDRVMDITDDDPAYVVKFKNAFQKDLAARRADTNETWFKVATALDPRFKDLKCLPREKREQVKTVRISWTNVSNLSNQIKLNIALFTHQEMQQKVLHKIK